MYITCIFFEVTMNPHLHLSQDAIYPFDARGIATARR
jgi:hypothetical protein